MLSFNHFLISLTLHISPTVSELYTPCQNKYRTRQGAEGCRDKFMRGLDRRLSLNYGCWIIVSYDVTSYVPVCCHETECMEATPRLQI
jgi:hypothetical protein